jgi:hypothetical protein
MVEAAVVARPLPTAFFATVEIVYSVPAASPEIVTALEICAAVTVITIGVPPPAGVAMMS